MGYVKKPIIKFLGEQLHTSLNQGKLLFNNSCCIALHIGWTFYYNNNKITHANTLLINPKCNESWLFEPQGTILNFDIPIENVLKKRIYNILFNINKNNNINYKGYLTPKCNFQKDNYNLCYMWTTWLELLVVLNPYLTPNNIAKYLNYRYTKIKK